MPGAAAPPRIARAQHVQAFQAGQKRALASFRKATPRLPAGRARALRPAPALAPKTVARTLPKPALTFPRQAQGGARAAAATSLRTPAQTRFAKPKLDPAALKRAGVQPQVALKAAQKRHVQADALASGFLKRNRQQLGAVRASGRTLGRQIQAAAVRARAQLRAAAGQAQGSLRGHFARSRARVTGRAAASRAQITAQQAKVLAGLPTATRSARAKVTAAHARAAAQARTGSQTQKAAVRAAYGAVAPMYTQAGDAVGAQARARAETQARAYESHVTGEDDSFLDGPLTDNRWKARAGAARDVGAAYAPGFRDQAQEEAQRLVGPDGGLGKDLSNIDAALQATLGLLREQLTASHKRLDERERQARTQALSAYRRLTGAVQSQLAGTLNSLGQAERSSVAAVARQAQAHAAGLDRQASGAQAGLQKRVEGLAGQLDRSLAGFDRQIRASQAPDPRQLSQLLAGAQRSVTAGLRQAQAGLGRNVAGLSAGLRQGAAQSGAALGQAAQAGGQQAAGLAGGFDRAGAGMVAQATSLFQELARAHQQGSAQEGQGTGQTLAGLTRGLEDLYAKTLSGLPAQLRATVGPLRKALEGNFTNEDAQIRQNAEEAAAQVQPRWKSWVKIALMVAVIIVVAVVAGPAVIGAVGAMAGALGAGAAAGTIGAVVGGAIVGAASGAVIQMANNAVDNIGMDAKYQKSVFEGVGKAALIGAAGGALGGAGGALVGKLGAMGALGSGLTQKAAGFALGTTFDLGGNVMGDVMGGMSLGDALKNLTNPETLMMMAIGTGAGVAAHGVAVRNARPEGPNAGTGTRPSLPERAQAAGERAGNRAGDVVNDLTGNRRGAVRTEVNPALAPQQVPARITGYAEGRPRMEVAPNAHPRDVSLHQEYLRNIRSETSPVQRLTDRIRSALGGGPEVVPGSRRWELATESAKHGDMADWRFKEAQALPANSRERTRLLQEAHDHQRMAADYEQAAASADARQVVDDSVIEARRKLYANHDEIQDLLGKPFDVAQLPDRYVTIEVEGGRKVAGRLKSDGTFDMTAAVLLVRPDGTVQVNPTNRITYDYIAKYQADPNAIQDLNFGRDGHTLHHAIPDKVSTSDPLCVKAMQLTGYSPDRMSNYHPMPMERLYRQLDGQEVGHWSSHAEYDQTVVRPALRDSMRLLETEFGAAGTWTADHPRIADLRTAITYELQTVERMLIQRIADGNVPMTTENTAGGMGRIR
ncbi:AHH domain-containing protein [uncultured Deinococcus sp.]|uniref:AHH domain-containing protein n=1 Tax=uncultured Deinococcus sp. TaxID=158789 RepID=UPI00258B493E|nr:AHH domain-containing protein [uncultured Deinococcus sp.]